MRIDLVTPFAEKDAAKALGARWDSARKTWYITDVSDLTPFERWIPDMATAAAGNAPDSTGRPTARERPVPARRGKGPATTGPAADVPHCGCQVLPWEDCEHSVQSRAAG